jgi:hypothetical protein
MNNLWYTDDPFGKVEIFITKEEIIYLYRKIYAIFHLEEPFLEKNN